MLKILLCVSDLKFFNIKMEYTSAATDTEPAKAKFDEIHDGDDTIAVMSEKENEEKHLQILMAVVPMVVPILFTLIIIIGFIGNLLVILVVLLNKTMRNTTNILIFNLAVRNIEILFITNC